jgi:hypothetical protein
MPELPFISGFIREQHAKKARTEANRAQLSSDLWIADGYRDQHLSGREQINLLSPHEYTSILDNSLNHGMPYGPQGRLVDDEIIRSHQQFVPQLAQQYNLSERMVRNIVEETFPKGVADMKLSDLCRITPPADLPYGCLPAKNGQVMVGRRHSN